MAGCPAPNPLVGTWRDDARALPSVYRFAPHGIFDRTMKLPSGELLTVKGRYVYDPLPRGVLRLRLLGETATSTEENSVAGPLAQHLIAPFEYTFEPLGDGKARAQLLSVRGMVRYRLPVETWTRVESENER